MRRGFVRASFTVTCVATLLFAARARGAEPAIDRLVIAPDTSGSLDVLEYETVMGAISNQLDAIVEEFGISEIGILPWAGEASCWRGVQRSWAMPGEVSVGQTKVRDGEAERIFRRSKEKAELEARVASEKDSVAADSAYRCELRKALVDVKSALRGIKQGWVRCTAVSSFVDRCGMEDSRTVVLAISDGKDDCDDERPRNTLAPWGGAKLVFVIVPAMGDERVAEAMQCRMNRIKDRAPSAQCVPSFQLDRPGTTWLRDALTTEVASESGGQPDKTSLGNPCGE